MSFNWIKITERAAEGIKIINGMDDRVYTTLVNYVHKNMGPENENECSDESLEKLEQLIGIDRADFLLVIKTVSYILKRASLFITKPTTLQAELQDKLKLNDSKVQPILNIYMKRTKSILDGLVLEDGSTPNELEDITWKLNVQISSQTQQKDKTVVTQLHLTTTDQAPINLEMNHNELLKFYNQLETIQAELDGLNTNSK